MESYQKITLLETGFTRMIFLLEKNTKGNRSFIPSIEISWHCFFSTATQALIDFYKGEYESSRQQIQDANIPELLKRYNAVPTHVLFFASYGCILHVFEGG